MEDETIELTFNSMLSMKMRRPNLSSSPMASSRGYVHVANTFSDLALCAYAYRIRLMLIKFNDSLHTDINTSTR
jgi:hypothetical protein